MDGDLWDTPAKQARAIARIACWQRYRPLPWQRIDIPKKHGQRRPLSIPAMVDRARQALYLHAWQPSAETVAAPTSSGVRPKRQGAEAIDQCCNVLRQHTSATWSLAGDIHGFVDTMAFSWIEAHIPMHKGVLSKGLRSGDSEHGALYPTTAGVPPGGSISPVVSHLVLEGLEAVVHGGAWHRRGHHIHDVRWADDCIVTAHARPVLADTILPRITACLAERGVRRSTEKTVMTPITDGFDFLGQTLRQHARRHGKPPKRQIPPSQGRFQGINTQVKALGKQAVGAPPAQLIERLNPVLRGWANDHRHILCGETFATRDSFVWRRLSRWAKPRHPDKTGRWMTNRYFPHHVGESWRFTDPMSGLQSIRGQEAVTPQRHVKIKGAAHPFDPQWEAYFQHHDRPRALRTTAVCRATILNQQTGVCPICRQVIQRGETLAWHHRDGHHQKNRRANLGLLHPPCHRPVHDAPASTTASTRPAKGGAHA